MRLWQDKIDVLSRIWRNKYPAVPRSRSPIEKIFSTTCIILCMGSLSNLRNLLPEPKRRSRWFMDVYVLLWATLLAIMLFSGRVGWCFAIPIAAYRLMDIVSYRLYFLLVKSEEKPWTADVLRRSILIVVVNFYEVVTAFAILYLATGSIASSKTQTHPVSHSSSAFYFSLVTMTTLGYGDYLPINALGRGLVIAQLSTVLLFLIFLLPALVSVFSPGLTQRTNDHRD